MANKKEWHHWRDIRKEPPVDAGYYLVWTIISDGPVYIAQYRRDLASTDWVWSIWLQPGDMTEKITHWMELPPKP
ncbi:MAG: hypothetical protein ACYCQI_13615 [Gammaproteobacteria bacterium]